MHTFCTLVELKFRIFIRFEKKDLPNDAEANFQK